MASPWKHMWLSALGDFSGHGTMLSWHRGQAGSVRELIPPAVAFNPWWARVECSEAGPHCVPEVPVVLNCSFPQQQILIYTPWVGSLLFAVYLLFSTSASCNYLPSETPALQFLFQDLLLGKMSPRQCLLWNMLTGHETRESHFRKNCSRQLCSFDKWEAWGPGSLCGQR